jgi:hypothetical protein
MYYIMDLLTFIFKRLIALHLKHYIAKHEQTKTKAKILFLRLSNFFKLLASNINSSEVICYINFEQRFLTLKTERDKESQKI